MKLPKRLGIHAAAFGLKPPPRRSAIAADLRTPKYKPRVIPNKKRAAKEKAIEAD